MTVLGGGAISYERGTPVLWDPMKVRARVLEQSMIFRTCRLRIEGLE